MFSKASSASGPFERKDSSAYDFHTFLLIWQPQDGIGVDSLSSEFRISDHPEDNE